MSKTMKEQMLLLKESFDSVGTKFNGLTWQRIEKSHLEFSQSQTQELIEQNRELKEMLEKSLGALNDCCIVIDSEDEVFEYIKSLSMDITKVLFNYRTKINVK